MKIDSNSTETGRGIGSFWSHEDKYCFKVVANKEGGTVLALALKRRC